MSLLVAYIFLAVAILAEMVATSVLPSSEGFTKLKPSIISIIGYVICFFCLGLALLQIPLGIAYGTWGALGTAVTPAIGYVLYRQRTSRAGMVGVVLIMIGVVMLNLWG